MLRVACLLSGLVMLWFAGCDGETQDEDPVDESRGLLRHIDGCEDVEEMIRRRVGEQMRAIVMENYHAVLESGYCLRATWDDGDGDADTDIDGDEDGSSYPFSTTGAQDGAIDRPDFVETYGEHIFLVAGTELLIIDAIPASEADIVARVELEGVPSRLFVHEDHALVYSELRESDPDVSRDDCYFDEFRREQVCGATQQRTLITIVDIADLEHPSIERMIEIAGPALDSFRINDVVYNVMSFPDFGLLDFVYCPGELHVIDPSDQATLWRAFSEVIDSNDELITNTPIEGWVPTITDTRFSSDGAGTASSDFLAGCDGFYETENADGRSTLSIMSFDFVVDNGEVEALSIIGDQGVVSASRDALTVVSRHYDSGVGSWYFDDSDEIPEATTVHRFVLEADSPAMSYQASGVLPGRVLDQFSMGEQGGFLRIATTLGHHPDPEASNNVFVLEAVDGILEIVGEVTDIAPSEDMGSARFVGDRGFVVSSKKTDPLLTFDLSDPTEPRIVGELHVPGFSTSMHMMDLDHVFSIGFDAEDYGDYAMFRAVQLQIFDVSNMSNPTRSHIEIIGTRGMTIPSTSPPLTIDYFEELDILAIPMAICEEDPEGTPVDEMSFNGTLVYDVTVAAGFQERGRISHGDPPIGYDCSNWWTDSSYHVKRVVIMDDALFSIAPYQIIVASLEDLSTAVAWIDYP